MKNKTFTKVPSELMRNTTLTPATKLVLGYILTRSKLKEWEVRASNIETECGVSDATVSRIVKELSNHGVLKYKETRQFGGEFPSRIYTIDKNKLNSLIFEEKAVTKCNGGDYKMKTPQLQNVTVAVSKCNLQEDIQEISNKKDIQEEAISTENLLDLMAKAQANFDAVAPKQETVPVALKQKETIQPALSAEQMKQLDADWETIRQETLKSQGMSQGYFNKMRSLAASPKFSPLGYKI
jgi:hypothetical protein